MKPITRICKARSCKRRFEPKNATQIVHSYKCGLEYSTYLRERKEKKEGVERRKRIKVMKEGLMSYSKWQARLQPEVNHIARLIDYGQLCISCGKKGKEFGGHYHSQGGNAMIRFHLHNIHLQDYQCNFPKSSNKTGYNLGLINIYGKEYQEYVEFTLVREYPSVKPSIPELQEAIKISRSIVRRMKADPIKRTPKERMELRTKLNIEIGIYTI